MEQRLFILLFFFTGFIPLVLSVPRKYFLIKQGKKWSDAQTYCKAKYIDLAIIRNNRDLIQLRNEIQTQQFSSSAWIGLSVNINSWRWSKGNEPLGSMRPWASTEPNNNGGKQECGGIAPWGWLDLICTVLYPFICFDDRYTGNQRYIYFPNSMTWHDAQSYCRQYHTDLASSRDNTEDLFIKGLTNSWTWFGLFRDSWKWTDQTNFSILSWMTGQPNNAQRLENCGYINNSQVADALCSNIMPFFCYADIIEQQYIVRVKVQSSDDVNDPAVKAAILEQINQKLKEKVMMGNFTVKWREQSDGAKFHKVKEEKNTTVENKNCDL